MYLVNLSSKGRGSKILSMKLPPNLKSYSVKLLSIDWDKVRYCGKPENYATPTIFHLIRVIIVVEKSDLQISCNYNFISFLF